jgi:hypothetical protein
MCFDGRSRTAPTDGAALAWALLEAGPREPRVARPEPRGVRSLPAGIELPSAARPRAAGPTPAPPFYSSRVLPEAASASDTSYYWTWVSAGARPRPRGIGRSLGGMGLWQAKNSQRYWSPRSPSAASAMKAPGQQGRDFAVTIDA